MALPEALLHRGRPSRRALLMSLMAAAPLAAGCSASSKTSSGSGGDGNGGHTTLTFWTFQDWTTGIQGKALDAGIAAFEKANPDITIKVVPKVSTDIETGVAAAAGTHSIDVLNTQLRASTLVNSNSLYDLSSLWNKAPASFRGQFNPQFTRVLSQSGKVWGVPYTTTASVVYRNLTVLKAAGIDPATPPKTWADWLAEMKKIKAAGKYALANQLVIWLNALNIYSGVPGATFQLTKDGKSTTLNPTDMGEAMAFIKSTEPYAAPVDSGSQGETDLFSTNKMAFLISGAWTYPQLEAVNGLKFDSIPIPGMTAAKPGGVNDGEFYAIAAGSRNVDAAWKFIQFMTGATQAAQFSVAAGRYIANNVALQSPAVKSDAFIQQQSKIIGQTLNDAPFLELVPADAPNAFADGFAKLKAGTDPMSVGQFIVSSYNSALNE